ncbi:phosphatidylserine decarboxylase family protein [Flavobacteriaceae bacterium]|nr:phosphatidylserine decarboxylase family protein [Flavobacteriaceae bacterium]MDB4058521.1 phosphatidylserine decarboxylase family protein [Flavobacteriaceae bacterium]MDB9830911.1 phosphatidylserine decarboxylase family protein [Flavobacteriaceae bacterium]MDC0106962.1 phosphatidylserine decarboxylase family protein [Flavobacteriaceae bacterium]MDC0119193.1 phosphatidylserine decarboxylase family protein [Flavobacteriaceae bacterium]
MFHREGFKIIAITFIIVGVIALTADTYITQDLIKYGVQGVALAVLVLILQFFRNPKRAVQFNLNEIIAPVDGKVVVIEEVEEKEYFQGKRKQVSIFMSPLNVHVTRYPVSGVIQYSKYHPGKYLVAWHPKASEENERTTIVIKTPKFGDILYRQIAGALARRIVNYAKKGDKAIQGADAGFIKFGSRVDLFLPLDCIVTLELNQKVVGAKTVIATLSDGDE